MTRQLYLFRRDGKYYLKAEDISIGVKAFFAHPYYCRYPRSMSDKIAAKLFKAKLIKERKEIIAKLSQEIEDIRNACIE